MKPQEEEEEEEKRKDQPFSGNADRAECLTDSRMYPHECATPLTLSLQEGLKSQ